MAAAITTTATTLEGQLFEILTTMQVYETDPTKNSTNKNAVVMTVNTDAKLVTASVNLSIDYVVGATGTVAFSAVPYLS